MKLRVPHTPEHLDWLQAQLHDGDVLAVAGDSVAPATLHRIERYLAETGATVRIDLDLPGTVWVDRPALPRSPVTAHDPAFATTPRAKSSPDFKMQWPDSAPRITWCPASMTSPG